MFYEDTKDLKVGEEVYFITDVFAYEKLEELICGLDEKDSNYNLFCKQQNSLMKKAKIKSIVDEYVLAIEIDGVQKNVYVGSLAPF